MKNWVLGNWKMNQSLEQVDDFFSNLQIDSSEKAVCGVAPQAIHASYCLDKKNDVLNIGIQNGYFEDAGAFTGETSMVNAKELGISFVIIGHSERRALFAEKDENLAKKVKKAQDLNLQAVFCVGETLEQREAGNAWDIISKQLESGLKSLNNNENLVVAYEPVWAIGTGKTATTEQASDIHNQIRNWLTERFGANGESTPILYGGSVKPENFADLLAQKEIAGGLVGGASLKAGSFNELVKIAQS